MRLIDAEDYERELMCIDGDEDTVYNAVNALDRMPTVEPVKHGRWIAADEIADPQHPGIITYAYGYGQCSVCKGIVWLAVTKSGNMKYCPECGAKMDEVAEHE